MNTKIISFDLEMAKKIQAGEINGAIKTRDGSPVRLLCTNLKDSQCIVAAVAYRDGSEHVEQYSISGNFLTSCAHSDFDLFLEVPDNKPEKPQFKPFDKVLVRRYDDSLWQPAFFWKFVVDELSKTSYYTINGNIWTQCIPYEGNQHLVGTTNKPKEE